MSQFVPSGQEGHAQHPVAVRLRIHKCFKKRVMVCTSRWASMSQYVPVQGLERVLTPFAAIAAGIALSEHPCSASRP